MNALLLLLLFLAPPEPQRPHIYGIDHVVLLATDKAKSTAFYNGQLGLPIKRADHESGLVEEYVLSTQWIGIAGLTDPARIGRLQHVALETDDVEGMRKYLLSKKLKINSYVTHNGRSAEFSVNDPEGNVIEFVQHNGVMLGHGSVDLQGEISSHLIHAGFIVHDRAAEDRFYRDLLGFRLYWHGGMKDSATDWVDMQVPDGTDWIEYMLNGPAKPDPRLAGILDHIALAVPDVRAAAAKLNDAAKEKPQIGRDGKWQLNLYDPDLTRVELMEPAPVQKPCCSEYTGKHPVLPSSR